MLSYVVFVCFELSAGMGVAALWFDRRSPINRSYAAASFLYSVWAFSSIFVYASDDQSLVMASYQLGYVCGFLSQPALLWFYLALAGQSLRLRILLVVPVFALTAFACWQCFVTNFHFVAFVPGPYGNLGVPGQDNIWAVAVFYAFGLMQIGIVGLLLRARRRERSVRVRRIILVVAMALIGGVALFVVVRRLEAAIGLPPLSVLAGLPMFLVDFYLIAAFRYLRRNDGLIQRELRSVIDDAVVFLDEKRRVVSANDLAKKTLAPETFIGKDFLSVFEESVLLAEEWELAAGRGTPHRGVPVRLNGNSIVVRLRPVFDRHSDFIGAIAIVEKTSALDLRAEEFGISVREKEIISMLVQGFRNQEIADSLFLSVGTVKNHLFNIFKKTGSSNRVELFALFSHGDSTVSLPLSSSSPAR